MAALAAIDKHADRRGTNLPARAFSSFRGVYVLPTQPLTKDMLLRQVDGLRDLSRRARHLAETMLAEEDKRRLGRYVEELDERASALERQAVDAKTGQFAVAAPRPVS